MYIDFLKLFSVLSIALCLCGILHLFFNCNLIKKNLIHRSPTVLSIVSHPSTEIALTQITNFLIVTISNGHFSDFILFGLFSLERSNVGHSLDIWSILI